MRFLIKLHNARLLYKACYLQLHRTISFPVGEVAVVTFEMWPEGTLLPEKEQLIFLLFWEAEHMVQHKAKQVSHCALPACLLMFPAVFSCLGRQKFCVSLFRLSYSGKTLPFPINWLHRICWELVAQQ